MVRSDPIWLYCLRHEAIVDFQLLFTSSHAQFVSSEIANFRGGACANKEVWAALGSKCKCKQRNVLRNMFVCICGWTADLCIVIVSCLCLIKLIFTAVVTVIFVNAGLQVFAASG